MRIVVAPCQFIKKADDFMKGAKGLEQHGHSSITEVATAVSAFMMLTSEVAAARVLKCEGCLYMSLSNKNREVQRGLVRKENADIGAGKVVEDNVQPVLLEAARKLLDA